MKGESKETMSRGITFRGKRVDNGEWVYGVPCAEYMVCDMTTVYCDDEIPMSKYAEIDYVEIDTATVGQFTGFHDMHGKKIYEGDIGKAIALSNDHHQRGAIIKSPVEILNGGVCLSINDVPFYPFCVDHVIEVIGNIYDFGGQGHD